MGFPSGLPAIQETRVLSLRHEVPLEEDMTTLHVMHDNPLCHV